MAKFIDLDTGLPALLNKVKAWVNSKTEDFITAEDAAGIVAATGDIVIVESDNYIDILITESQVNITPASLALYAAQKSAVIKVSGTHLKNDISISVPTGFTASPSTIAQVDGTVAQTDVTIAYTGADASTASGNITATAGDVVKSIPVAYSQYAGPTIIADSPLTIKAAAGQSNTGQLAVTGLNLTAGITATVSGTGFTVSASESGTYGDQASLPSSGGTLYVKFSPTGSSASTGTLTLASTGATSKTVDLAGAVATLTVSPLSLSFSTDQGVAVTDSFTIQGTNLTNGVSLSITGTNAAMFTLSKNSLTKAEAEAGETITVTYNSSNAGNHSGSIAVNWDGTTQTISLSGTAAVAATSDEDGKFTKLDANGNTLYLKRIIVDGQKTTNVEVHQGNYDSVWNGTVAETYSGNIVIPANVVVDGVTCTITEIAANAFRYNYNGSKLKSITLPNTITHIGLYFLYKATAVTSLVVPSSVETIQGGFCSNATSLASIDMQCATNPNFQTTWGSVNNAWLNNTKITSIRIPDKVQTIANNEMRGCTSLASITFGTDLVEFANLLASGRAENVTEVICRGTTTIPVPNSTRLTTYDIKSTIYQNAVLKVPDGYLAQYEAKLDQAGFGTAIWSNFVNRTTYVLDINN